MKRVGGLWSSVTDFSNLLLAARKAQKGKRFRPDVLEFNADLEGNLFALQGELFSGGYHPGRYHTFVIFEPKRRLISAAPYRDRVTQHALCNLIEPVFSRRFSPSSYANRLGMGTHPALRRFIRLARRFRYCLRLDIRQYFPSIDHESLKAIIRRSIKCRETLRLIDLIVDFGNPQEPVPPVWVPGDDLFSPALRRRGLPIGNLTSQLWANVYLDRLDHEIENRFGGRRYIRYVDDFALFSDDRAELENEIEAIGNGVNLLRLKLHQSKTELVETRGGVNFLGFRVFPDRVRVRAENLKRARRRLRRLGDGFAKNRVSLQEVKNSIQSWVAHLEYGDTWRLREKIFADLVLKRPRKGEDTPAHSGRQLEQQLEQLPLGRTQQQHAGQPEQRHRVPCCASSFMPEPPHGNAEGVPKGSPVPLPWWRRRHPNINLASAG